MRWEKRKQKGFTIVELLIVIVVIAILAAITIVAYNGITKQAVASILQSDLRNARVAVENARTLAGGELPVDIRTLNNGAGITLSNGNHLLYLKMGGGYCMAVRNGLSNEAYYTSNGDATVRSGDCSAVVTVSTPPQPAQAGGFGIAVDSAGNVYTSFANRIRKLTPSGTLTNFAGSGVSGYADGSAGVAQFQGGDNGMGIEPSGSLIIADEFSRTIRRVTMNGDVTTIAGINGSTTSVDGQYGINTINRPVAVTVQGGFIYIAETYGNKIRRLAPDGTLSTVGSLSLPTGVAVDSSGAAFVTSGWGSQVRRVTSVGTVTTFAGSPTEGGRIDAVGTAARFFTTKSIAMDKSGNMFIGDMSNRQLRVVTPSGAVFTVAGTGGNSNVDGSGATAQFTSLSALAVGGDGVVYIGAPFGSVRKVSL